MSRVLFQLSGGDANNFFFAWHYRRVMVTSFIFILTSIYFFTVRKMLLINLKLYYLM